MNKYIIPVCDIPKSKIYNVTISANSIASCQDKFIERYSQYSDSNDWKQFVEDLNEQDILIGTITDIEVL